MIFLNLIKIKFIVYVACLLFHNKSKQLEIMTMILYVVVYRILLRICNSHPCVCSMLSSDISGNSEDGQSWTELTKIREWLKVAVKQGPFMQQ